MPATPAAPPAAPPARPAGRRVAVRIRSEDGREGGRGTIEYETLPLRRRLARAGTTFLLGLVIGALLLPVPLIHLFGLMFFLGMTGVSLRRLGTGTVLLGAEGGCPSCRVEGPLFVGLGGRRLAFPVRSSCPKCHVHLELEPLAPGSGV